MDKVIRGEINPETNKPYNTSDATWDIAKAGAAAMHYQPRCCRSCCSQIWHAPFATDELGCQRHPDNLRGYNQ